MNGLWAQERRWAGLNACLTARARPQNRAIAIAGHSAEAALHLAWLESQ